MDPKLLEIFLLEQSEGEVGIQIPSLTTKAK